MPALVNSANYLPQWQISQDSQTQKFARTTTATSNMPPPGYLTGPQQQQQLLYQAQMGRGVDGTYLATEVHPNGGLMVAYDGTASAGVMCRRQKSFYVLLALFVLGILLLVFIVVFSSIVYITRKCVL